MEDNNILEELDLDDTAEEDILTELTVEEETPEEIAAEEAAKAAAAKETAEEAATEEEAAEETAEEEAAEETAEEEAAEEEAAEEPVPEDEEAAEAAPADEAPASEDGEPASEDGEPAEKSGEAESASEEPVLSELELSEEPESDSISRESKIRSALIGIFFVGLLAAAYIYGINYYKTHFLPNTYLDGIEVGELTAEEAADKLRTAYDDHIFRLTGREGDAEELDISEAAPIREYQGIAEALAAQNRNAWIIFRRPVKELPLDFHGSYDPEGLQRSLDNSVLLSEEHGRAPEDAYIAFDEESGLYAIVPEDPGTKVDRDLLTAAMETELKAGHSHLDLEEAGSYEAPTIFSDDAGLNAHLAELNSLQELHAAVDMGADTLEMLSGEELYDLITGVSTPEDYVAGLVERYNTYDPDSQRLFHKQDGSYILMKASYGWRLDEEKTLEAVRGLIRKAAGDALGILPAGETAEEGEASAEGAAANIAPASGAAAPAEGGQEADPYRIAAVWKNMAVVHDREDYGTTYAEVDLSAQTVYLIQNGETVFSSPCVSGRMTKGRITPGGIYDIKYKQTNKVLTGYKPDGTVDYRSPVSYWMPFNGGIGFHDATWRGSFGGTIYVYSGSHGCINLPFSKAKELYSLVYKGMPVILYY